MSEATATEITTMKVVDTMSLFGGSFVRSLAQCYWSADHSNKARIEKAFPDYFAKYRQLAEVRAGKEVGQ